MTWVTGSMSSLKPIPSEKPYDPSTGSDSFIYSPPSGTCGCVDCEGQYRSEESQCIDRLAYTDALSSQEATNITTSYAKQIKADA